jgi:hypothetical protein
LEPAVQSALYRLRSGLWFYRGELSRADRLVSMIVVERRIVQMLNLIKPCQTGFKAGLSLSQPVSRLFLFLNCRTHKDVIFADGSINND